MAEKRYYWLKLQEDFFRQPAMRKLRRMAGGETFTIIYLKMQLLSLKQNGALLFEHLEDDFSKELAFSLEEEADDVAATMNFLRRYGLLEVVEADSYKLPEVLENIGSKTAAAKRMEKMRKGRGGEASQSYGEQEGKTSLCYGSKNIASLCYGKTGEKGGETSQSYVEKRREEKEKSRYRGEEEKAPPAPPSLEEVEVYCRDNGLHMDAGHFFRYFEASGWRDKKGRRVENWRQKALEWEKYERDTANGKRGKYAGVSENKWIEDFQAAEERQKKSRPRRAA